MPAINFEDPLLRSWAFYSALLMVKMLGMSMLTGATRFKYKAFANPEDGASLKIKPRVDENVERVRRAHLNDMENIPTFVVISWLYTMTNPSIGFATMLFRLAVAGRYLHTFVYAVCPLPQPARAIAFFVPYGICWYMGINAITYFMS